MKLLPTLALAGLTYYDHSAIPGWRGSLLLAALKGSQLTQLPLDAAGLVTPTRTSSLAGFGRLRAICVSPQGRVYVGTSNRDGRGSPAAPDDRILVLENRAYVGAATRPAADFTFGLFPNPARRQALPCSCPWPAAACWCATCWGRAVLSLPPTPGRVAMLDVAALRPGTYFVQAIGPGGRATRKLLLE